MVPAPVARAEGCVLVLGECLVDLAPAPPNSAGDAAKGTGPPNNAAQNRSAQNRSAQNRSAQNRSAQNRSAQNRSAQNRSAQPQERQHLVAMPGGGPANIAVGLARLEVPCTFAGRFARGGFGPWLRQNLRDNGLDLSYSVDADEPATLALVTLDCQGRASYTFYGPTTADWQWANAELPDLSRPKGGQPPVTAVHTGSLVLQLGTGASAIVGWLAQLHQESRVLISFDPNVRPAFVDDLPAYRERVTKVVRSSDIVKASDEDVEVLYPGTEPEAVAEKWLSFGVHLVVITEGPDGATAYHHSRTTEHRSPPPVELADTIGAGDAFTSGLLAYFREHALLHPGGIAGLSEAQLRGSLAQAVAAGTFTCSRPGADPPSQVELTRFLDGGADPVP